MASRASSSIFDAGPVSDEARQQNHREPRKPWFGGMALALALIAVIFSLSMFFSGRGAGFEGFGAMLIGLVIGGLGVICVGVLALISKARKEQPAWMPLLSVAVAVFGMFLLMAAG